MVPASDMVEPGALPQRAARDGRPFGGHRERNRLPPAIGRRELAVALVLAQPAYAAQAEVFGDVQRSVAVFAGPMSDNEWGDLFIDWGSVEWRNAYVGGANVSWEWPLRRWGFVGIEAQVGKWFGEQDHLEFSFPVFYRTPRPHNVFIPSLAYGLGLSYATAPPQTEVARTGESTELLATWFFEMEFGNGQSEVRPYLRVHHRSHAWQTFGARTGSNALVAGLRWFW